MSRSRWAATFSILLMAVLVMTGLIVPVPFVSIGRGPTYDTLGKVDGADVVTVHSLATYPTSGHLNMTTVSLTDGLTALEALRRWWSSDYMVLPRSMAFPPGETNEQINQRNQQDFADSQASAEGAAFVYLKLPTVAVVEDLADGDSAARGVLQPGDSILSIGGVPVTTPQQISDALANTHPGQRISVAIRRGDDPQPHDVSIQLGGRADTQQGLLGIYPGARPADRNEVSIALGDVGGPSAGLMFTLAIVDKLTPGEMTSGRFVAGTGTITSSGLVGRIEGIRYKMLAAREAGATAFLVPAGNCADAAGNVPDGLTIAKVSNLQEAVTAVETLGHGGTPPAC
ncbi:YlbL family protein [Pseudonocardia sp. CA-107938]|uniref:YlbL family protein n=1 Tax=Pseudonocardia sp. CA-107938 TaxID=3240021 RepID=UPI003D8E8D03